MLGACHVAAGREMIDRRHTEPEERAREVGCVWAACMCLKAPGQYLSSVETKQHTCCTTVIHIVYILVKITAIIST